MKTTNFNDLDDALFDYKSYQKDLESELKSLVDDSIKNNLKIERELQSFFEKHPAKVLAIILPVGGFGTN